MNNKMKLQTLVPVKISMVGMLENMVIETLGFNMVKNSEPEEKQKNILGFQLPLG